MYFLWGLVNNVKWSSIARSVVLHKRSWAGEEGDELGYGFKLECQPRSEKMIVKA